MSFNAAKFTYNSRRLMVRRDVYKRQVLSCGRGGGEKVCCKCDGRVITSGVQPWPMENRLYRILAFDEFLSQDRRLRHIRVNFARCRLVRRKCYCLIVIHV